VRRKRTDRLALVVPPIVRFWTGLSLIPGYFMIRSLPVKFLLVGIFALLAYIAGKKIRFLYFFVMTLSIAFFHLLTPSGRILWDIGPLLVTSTALSTGILKGVTLSGLVFLSLFSITPSLKLPGRLGGLLGRMFYYFEEILDGRKKISPKNFIGSLDRILMEIFPPGDLPEPAGGSSAAAGRKTYPFQAVYILVLEALVWGFVIWEFLF
jgi:hypothetical protein